MRVLKVMSRLRRRRSISPLVFAVSTLNRPGNRAARRRRQRQWSQTTLGTREAGRSTRADHTGR